MFLRRPRALSLAVTALFFHQLLGFVAPSPTMARVDPLTIIKRQIHKPNMLVLLDTSGSLTGVPGGSFDYSDEVGVDCDDGENCRGGISEGVCAANGKLCFNDDTCRTNSCAVGGAACAVNSDCAPVAGRCGTGQNCFATEDCPVLTSGRCAYDNDSCSPSNTCDKRLRCKIGNNSCSSDSGCPTGTCASTGASCRSNNDCAFATSGGTCTWGTTPPTGCAQTSHCPARPKSCSDNPAVLCTTVNDCGGKCKKNLTACHSNNDCKVKANDYCDFTGKTCTAPSNSCILPRLTCNVVNPTNACIDKNTCVPNANPCTGAATNTCLAGVDGDLCNAPATASGSRMCRAGQTRCTKDSQCTVPGDTCGPATSRFVIAKRVMRNIVSSNANVVNMGFMTFFQSGYYPYYRITSPLVSTKTQWISRSTLESRGCYSRNDGLDATCQLSGVDYTLRAADNARYEVTRSNRKKKNVDHSYCGYFCSIPGEGTGIFVGAYFTYQESTGGSSTLQAPPPTTYKGKSYSDGTNTYRYYDSRPDYYNPWGSSTRPPIGYAGCGSTDACSATCGGRWDSQLAPFLTTDDSQANVDAVIRAFNQAMEPASQGGLISYGGTPSGCALENPGSPTPNHSAYHYMKDVKDHDSLPCRQRYVLFVTDGEATGPGDVNCTSSKCAATDPIAEGCECRAVRAAYKLRMELDVKTFVVGFSADAASGNGRIINDNIARAGGTDAGDDKVAPFAYGASSEEQLNEAIQGAIYQAVKGSYSTAPATASQGQQQGSQLNSGTYVIDARVDFPSWEGHLMAYDVSGSAPSLVWDAATVMKGSDWKKRRIYTSNAANQPVLIDVDSSSGAIRNAGDLHALGLGATAEEAELIARFILGDPAMKNPAVLGAIINSTPVEIAAATESSLPGAHEFHVTHANRPGLTYVGANDGMLHAFVTRAVTVGSKPYPAGSEAFAYLPPSMFPKVAALYAQGGQLADPNKHIFGLASSPKVKNICFEDCNKKTAKWKTVLLMSEGWGGNGAFALDVTNPLVDTVPFGVVWSTATNADKTDYGNWLGETVSVPAYTFKRSDALDLHRVLMSSGYPLKSGQGRSLLSITAATGRIENHVDIVPPGTCTQDYALLTDVATSRQQVPSDNGAIEGRKELIAGYVGDTWGNMWRYEKNGQLENIQSFGCQHPLHFAPTVVQLDQDDPHNPHAGDIYLVQLTNSTYDRVTENFEASQMIIMKERFIDGRPKPDPTFGTNGKVVLTNANNTQMCAVTDATGTTCLQNLGSAARPLSSAVAIPKADGAGFTLISTWYEPATAGCGKGSTYFLMHEVNGAVVTVKQALKIADEPVVSMVVAAGKLMITGSEGPINIGGSVTTAVNSARAPSSSVGDLFRLSSWSEVD
jgi:hypothetical protein